jgi:hypothetical protein
MTPPQQQLSSAEQNALLDSVTTLLVHRLPGDWEELYLDLRCVGDYVESPASVLDVFGDTTEWKLPEEALPFFQQLRSGAYRPGTGTWTSARFRLKHPQQRSVDYEWVREPDWTHRPPQRYFLEELAAHPRPDDDVQTWLRDRAGLSSEDVPATETRVDLHLAPVFDGAHPGGRPSVDRPQVHPRDWERVHAYLTSAPVVLDAKAFGQDAFDQQADPDVPVRFHTDGTWVWSAATPYYWLKRDVPPAPQLVEHIRARGFRVPEVDDAALRAAEAVATGRTRPLPLPERAPLAVTPEDRALLVKLRERLELFGVPPHRYGLAEFRSGVPVLEPVPDGEGWQIARYADGRGPSRPPSVHPSLRPAAQSLLGMLLFDADLDAERAARLATPVIEALPGEAPLSLFRDLEHVTLPVGTDVDRFGDEDGNLVYVARTTHGNRSLPPEWANRRYHLYRVAKPVPVLRGVAVPWFGQVGGGTGFFLIRSIAELLADGILVELPPQV